MGSWWEDTAVPQGGRTQGAPASSSQLLSWTPPSCFCFWEHMLSSEKRACGRRPPDPRAGLHRAPLAPLTLQGPETYPSHQAQRALLPGVEDVASTHVRHSRCATPGRGAPLGGQRAPAGGPGGPARVLSATPRHVAQHQPCPPAAGPHWSCRRPWRQPCWRPPGPVLTAGHPGFEGRRLSSWPREILRWQGALGHF